MLSVIRALCTTCLLAACASVPPPGSPLSRQQSDVVYATIRSVNFTECLAKDRFLIKVPARQADAALEYLEKKGWKPVPFASCRPSMPSFAHAPGLPLPGYRGDQKFALAIPEAGMFYAVYADDWEESLVALLAKHRH